MPVLYNRDYLASVKLTGFQVSYVYELFSTIVNKRGDASMRSLRFNFFCSGGVASRELRS